MLREEDFAGAAGRAFAKTDIGVVYYRPGDVKLEVVPAGAHDVVFSYRPFKLYAAFGVSLITLAGMASLLISKRNSRC